MFRFFLFLILFCPFILRSQENYQFNRLDINKGLSQNQINCITKDHTGFMWFGTMSGLNRYDGYSFRIFRNDPDDTTSIKDNFIISVVQDSKDLLWVKTRSGFSVYDPFTEMFSQRLPGYLIKKVSSLDEINDVYPDGYGNVWFVLRNRGLLKYSSGDDSLSLYIHNPADPHSLASNDISWIASDNSGNIWVIIHNGIIQKINLKSGKIFETFTGLNKKYSGKWYDYRMFIDEDNDAWIYPKTSLGVILLKNETNELININRNSPVLKLNNDIVFGITQAEDGLIWIGTDHGGINVIDKANLSIEYIMSDPYDNKSLSQNSITTLYRDNTGIIWAGTVKKGINYYHEKIFKFRQIRFQSFYPSFSGMDDINCFAEDDRENLWIGTNEGGLIYYDRTNNSFRQFRHDQEKNSLSSDIIVDLCPDREGNLWIGTYFGGLNCFDGKSFKKFRHNPSDTTSLSDDRVWSIYEDKDGILWIGTLGGGLNRLDRKKGTFKRYQYGPNSVNSNFISSIIEDDQNNLWIGTAYGITVLDKKTNKFRYFVSEKNNPGSLSNSNVICLFKDQRGWIWAGTREGLNVLYPEKNTFRRIGMQEGLPDNTIFSILGDEKGNVWVSTSNGLSNIIISANNSPEDMEFSVKNYDESDGLQGKEFNERSALKTGKGELIFGGPNGFNIFYPDRIKLNENRPEVIFTGLRIFEQQVAVNKEFNHRKILTRSLAKTNQIVLKHKENMFSVEFAVLNYFQPEKNRYQYKLEGFNNGWLESNPQSRTITYTNLDPGTYTLHVKAANNDGYWNEKSSALKITILPPFWRTNLAYVIYGLVILLLLSLLRYVIIEKERSRNRIDQERNEARQRHEIDMLKIKFITNISHEFRTPLSLILTPLEKILKNTADASQKNHFLLIYRNARRLLNLVNQLLDFRRMEFRDFKFTPSAGDFVDFVREITYTFADMAEKKDIRLSFASDKESVTFLFDQDKIEKIIFNLLSNAFKFTPVKGKISVDMSFKEDDQHKSWAVISIQDTGIGISKEKQDKVFERFFLDDNPEAEIHQGTGIGLSLVNEFVRLHNGKIEFTSEPGNGTCFTINIPVLSSEDMVKIENEPKQPVHFEPVPELMIENPENQDMQVEKNRLPLLLLVEDNEDFRFYLKDNLKLNYRIVEAGNGKEGLETALEKIPDLIVSDIMMPVMDGMELCRNLKTEKKTSHIPVILLTARSSGDQKIEGYETGADDYITKPFSFEILESRIKNLIHQRELVKKSFQKKFELTPSEIKITPLDEKLVQKTIQLVESNISNPDFSVDRLAREVGMSRVHLYKKLSALTGKTPIEFIRIIRLRRAAQLLEKSQLTISEIAYQVGFNNPKYFTKYFKAEFQVLPSEYITKNKGTEEKKKLWIE